MNDDKSSAHTARAQTGGENTASVTIKTEEPDSATGDDKLPVMEPGQTTDTAAGQDKHGPPAGHDDDTKYLEFYGDKIPNWIKPKTVKVYKELQKEFGSVDEAARRQRELFNRSRANIGLKPVKEKEVAIKEKEVVIKVEEDEED